MGVIRHCVIVIIVMNILPPCHNIRLRKSMKTNMSLADLLFTRLNKFSLANRNTKKVRFSHPDVEYFLSNFCLQQWLGVEFVPPFHKNHLNITKIGSVMYVRFSQLVVWHKRPSFHISFSAGFPCSCYSKPSFPFCSTRWLSSTSRAWCPPATPWCPQRRTSLQHPSRVWPCSA